MSEFPIYKKQVLADYDRKMASGTLSSNLFHVTPGNLKMESVRVCEERPDLHDEKLLRDLFGQKENTAAYRKAIKNGNANPFRPLVNFLRDRSINTDENNIDLLAWLIDFRPRPYTNWRNDPSRMAVLSTEEETVLAGRMDKTEAESPPGKTEPIPNGPLSENSEKKGTRRSAKITAALLLFLALLGSAYCLWPEGNRSFPVKTAPFYATQVSDKPGGCMYWNDDHYETITCDQSRNGTLVVPLDTQRLARLKKVTDTGSISMSSIGRIWYFKSHGQLECFTAGGPYPLDTNRRLLPITTYMIHKYFHR